MESSKFIKIDLVSRKEVIGSVIINQDDHLDMKLTDFRDMIPINTLKYHFIDIDKNYIDTEDESEFVVNDVLLKKLKQGTTSNELHL